MKNKKIRIFTAACLFFLLISALLSLMLGSRIISLSEIIKFISGQEGGVSADILYYSRLPRMLASILSGAALAAAGGVLQNVLSNKLASPGIIGVNAGAGFGVTVCTALGFLSGWAVSVSAFAGSLLSVLIISFFAGRINASKTTVILGGVALNSILNAFTECITVLDSDIAVLTTEFRVGGFSAVSQQRLFPAAVMITVSFVILFTLFNELDIIALGDETAKSVGLPAGKYRIIFLILTALLAGAAVSFSGLLGFAGLIVPHFVRKITGNESRIFIPLTAAAGGAFVCFCDTLARIMFIPFELPVGILMAFIGAPLFVILLVRMKGGHSNA